MKLREYLNRKCEIYSETILGREIKLEESPALLIALAETDNPEYAVFDAGSLTHDDDETDKTRTYLLVLSETENDTDICEYDDDCCGCTDDYTDYPEEKTNREWLTENMQADGEISSCDIDAFIINGYKYDVYSCDFEFLSCCPHECIEILKYFAGKNAVSEMWLEKDFSRLSLCQYELDNSVFDALSGSDIVNIEALPAIPPKESLIGRVLNLSYGHYDIPKGFSEKDDEGNSVDFKVYGVFDFGRDDMEDIVRECAAEFDEDEDIREYLKETEAELERIFADNRRLLVIEYSADDDLQLNFYTKDFLDSKEGEVTLPGLLMGSFDEDDDVQKRTDLIGITFPGCDDAESIEVELLSCVRY